MCVCFHLKHWLTQHERATPIHWHASSVTSLSCHVLAKARPLLLTWVSIRWVGSGAWPPLFPSCYGCGDPGRESPQNLMSCYAISLFKCVPFQWTKRLKTATRSIFVNLSFSMFVLMLLLSPSSCIDLDRCVTRFECDGSIPLITSDDSMGPCRQERECERDVSLVFFGVPPLTMREKKKLLPSLNDWLVIGLRVREWRNEIGIAPHFLRQTLWSLRWGSLHTIHCNALGVITCVCLCMYGTRRSHGCWREAMLLLRKWRDDDELRRFVGGGGINPFMRKQPLTQEAGGFWLKNRSIGLSHCIETTPLKSRVRC